MAMRELDGTGENELEWERVLWRLQPFPDNYVPPTFLVGLSKNRNQRFFKCLSWIANPHFFTANVLPYRYWPLMLGACTISQHLSVVFIFLAVFTRVLDHTLDPRLLIGEPRCTHGQGILTRLPRAHCTCTHPPDAHCTDVC